MLYFFTFCVDINRHTKHNMIQCLQLMVSSIHKHNKEYKLICFTNFNMLDYDDFTKYNIEIRNYYDEQKIKLYNDKWLNLSFNKINIYKDLYDEFNQNFIWIDLDTIICSDITYLNDISNVFIENGGNCLTDNVLFKNNTSITIPRKKYIQGNFWKLNITLYNQLMNTLDNIIKKNLLLKYDLQCLFNYYIYIENGGNLDDIYILGNNFKPDSINGLAVWSKQGNTHATLNGLHNLFLENNTLKSMLYPTKEVHILSFTFFTIKKMFNLSKFKQLFM